jgi:hypothetical protein
MTFEEFFKKKKIDLEQLKIAEPALFAEFEAHYAVMGEKSFDHTKKYWFNELRRKYHTPEEVKTEKVHLENPIAEQTVTESLVNRPDETPIPKLGFKPKFKAPASQVAQNTHDLPHPDKQTTPETPAPKLGFKPKFKTAVKPSAPGEGVAPTDEKVNEGPVMDDSPKAAEEAKTHEAGTVAPGLGFKPKFRAAAKPTTEEPATNDTLKPTEEETKPAEEEATAPPKLGFKPKFKPKGGE